MFSNNDDLNDEKFQLLQSDSDEENIIENPEPKM